MFYCVFVTFPCGVLGQVLCLIVSISDLCILLTFKNVYMLCFAVFCIPVGFNIVLTKFCTDSLLLILSRILKDDFASDTKNIIVYYITK